MPTKQKLWGTCALLATTLITSACAVTAESLEQFNAAWAPAVINKDVEGVSRFYNPNSLVAQFPYKADANLVGGEAVSQMFAAGPFQLKDLKLTVTPLAIEMQDDIGLILKRWHIKHTGGEFKGLAVELLSRDTGKWTRQIDLGAGGLEKIADFVTVSTDDDHQTFDNATLNLLFNAQRPEEKMLKKVDETLTLTQGNYSLVIAKAEKQGKAIATISALEKQGDQWQAKIQLQSPLSQ